MRCTGATPAAPLSTYPTHPTCTSMPLVAPAPSPLPVSDLRYLWEHWDIAGLPVILAALGLLHYRKTIWACFVELLTAIGRVIALGLIGHAFIWPLWTTYATTPLTLDLYYVRTNPLLAVLLVLVSVLCGACLLLSIWVVGLARSRRDPLPTTVEDSSAKYNPAFHEGSNSIRTPANAVTVCWCPLERFLGDANGSSTKGVCRNFHHMKEANAGRSNYL